MSKKIINVVIGGKNTNYLNVGELQSEINESGYIQVNLPTIYNENFEFQTNNVLGNLNVKCNIIGVEGGDEPYTVITAVITDENNVVSGGGGYFINTGESVVLLIAIVG